MRAESLVLLGLLSLLVACKLLPQVAEQPPPPSMTQAAVPKPEQANTEPGADVKDQNSEPALAPTESTAEPAASGPAAQPAPSEAVQLEPVIEKSKDQIACEKRKGRWDFAGKSKFKTCIRPTRDSGKQCRKQGDCESVCLARSGTCAPFKPLFGCNEILQKDGSRVTLCID